MTTRGMLQRTPQVALVAALGWSAVSCVHAVAIRPAPSYEAYAFDAALPLDAALHVDADRLVQDARFLPSADCSGNRYPVDAREALRESVIGTLERLVEHVEPTPEPIDRAAMEARELDAVILVRADSFGIGLDGDTLAGLDAVAELTLVVSVFTGDGLQLRDSVYGSGVGTEGGGLVGCGEGAVAAGEAVETAIHAAMTELGELLVNHPTLRTVSTP